jgi:hypothetical protein
MKELEMNEMEKKANRIVNRKENEVDDELPPFLFAGFFILTIFFFLFGVLSKQIIFYIFTIIFFLLMITTTHIIKFIIFIKYRNDKEYQVAKKIVKNFEKKEKREQFKETIEKESQKAKELKELEDYANNI